MSSLKNNYVFQLTGTLLTSGTTVTISNDLELGALVAFTDARIVLRNRNATIIERCVGTALNGTLTLSKRGLEQGDTEVENAGLKKERREGTTVYVTILASQLADRENDNTFAGTQTFNNVIVDNQFTGPVFADATARDAAIPTPTAGMIIQTGNVYQGYNAGTAQWQDFDIGTPPPSASETVEGLVELATPAEQGSQTEDGTSGPLVIQAKNTAKARYLFVPAFLTSGANVQATFGTWAAVTDGSFRITIDGTARNIDGIDFTGVANMAAVASTIQTAIRGVTSGLETVTWTGTRLVITSGSDRSNSAITVTTTSTGTVGTDISGAGASDWMDCNVGNGTVTAAVATPSLHENLVVLLDSVGKIDSDFIDNNAILGEGVEALVDKDTFITGEAVTAGDSLFVEDMTTFVLATSVQNIGDVTGNTRVSIPAFGSGTASDELKLSLRKYVSPGVDLGVRIETDNAGDPSGTLFDADAIATVTEASLTTSLVDTTVTLAGSITIPLGTKVHIVLFAGTYGSETVNGTNYYGVGYTAIDTTTRAARTFNGTVWSAVQATRFYYTTSSLFTPKVLSLTDASYVYKLPIDVPRLATETKGVGENVIATTYGLNRNYTALETNIPIFLSDTAGEVATTPGTNIFAIGTAIDENSIFVGQDMISYGEDNIIVNLPTSRSHDDTTFTVKKSFTIDFTGEYRVQFSQSAGATTTCEAKLQANGVDIGSTFSTTSTTPVERLQRLVFQKGDVVNLLVREAAGSNTASVEDLLVKYSIKSYVDFFPVTASNTTD